MKSSKIKKKKRKQFVACASVCRLFQQSKYILQEKGEYDKTVHLFGFDDVFGVTLFVFMIGY